MEMIKNTLFPCCSDHYCLNAYQKKKKKKLIYDKENLKKYNRRVVSLGSYILKKKNLSNVRQVIYSSLNSFRRRQCQPTPVLLPKNRMDGGARWAAVHRVTKSWTRLSDFTFTFLFHALEKEMATHSSVPAWRIPGTVDPGGLPSTGSHRVGHD